MMIIVIAAVYCAHFMCHILVFPLQSSDNLRVRTLLSSCSHKEAKNEKTEETTKEIK